MIKGWQRACIFALILMLSCSVPAAEDTPTSQTIFGLHELVQIKELGITLPAKLDTGAGSASLSARHIKIVEDDDQEYVEFDLALSEEQRDELDIDIDEDKLNDLRLPLDGHVRIIRRNEDKDEDDKSYSRRPIIRLTFCMGHRQHEVDVNLTNRNGFSYPLLLGHKTLRALQAVVDSQDSMTAGEPNCPDPDADTEDDDAED